MGTVTAKRNAERPPLGSVDSSSASITAPVDAVEVSMSGAAPVTVIVSWSWPTSRVMSTVRNCCVATRTLVLVRLESSQRRLDGVGARRHRGETVLTRFVRHGLTRLTGRLVDQFHRHARDDAVGVPNRASQTARERLGRREVSGHGHHQADDQCLPHLHGHLSLIVPEHSRHPSSHSREPAVVQPSDTDPPFMPSERGDREGRAERKRLNRRAILCATQELPRRHARPRCGDPMQASAAIQSHGSSPRRFKLRALTSGNIDRVRDCYTHAHAAA